MKNIIDTAHRNVLIARNIEHLVNTTYFSGYYKKADEETKRLIKKCVDELNHDLLRRTLRVETLRELRVTASRLGIPKYTQYSKCVLQEKIEEIYKKKIAEITSKHAVPQHYIDNNDYVGLKKYIKKEAQK